MSCAQVHLWLYVEFCAQDPTLQAVAELVAPRILDADEPSEYSEAMHPVFDTSEAQSALASSGIRCPAADEELLSTYVDYLRRLAPDQIAFASE